MSAVSVSSIVVNPLGVPAGSYVVKFIDVETIDNDFGPGLEWTWEVTSGPHAGQRVRRITGDRPTPKNACGKILAGLAGKPLTANEKIELSVFVGRVYMAMVVETTTGGSKVDSVAPAPVE